MTKVAAGTTGAGATAGAVGAGVDLTAAGKVLEMFESKYTE